MFRNLLIIIFTLIPILVFGIQTHIEKLSLGDDQTTITGSLSLDIFGTLKGSKPWPSMTEVQRDALTPMEGMVIFNTTTSVVNVYSAGAWKGFNASIDGSGLTNQIAFFSATSTLSGDNNLLFDGNSLTVGGTVTANAFSGDGSGLTGLVLNHNDLQNIYGGLPGDYYHLAQTDYLDLTDSGTTTLHTHEHNSLPGYLPNEHIDWTNTTQDISTTGTVSATAFYGDGSNLTGVVGSGDLTGSGTPSQVGFFSATKTLISDADLAFDGESLTVGGTVTATAFSGDGSALTGLPTPVSNHNDLLNIDGGAVGEYYHLTNTQHTDLTDGGTTTLHMHDHNSLPGYVANEHIDWTNSTQDISTTGSASAVSFYGDGSHLTGIVAGGTGNITGEGTPTQVALFTGTGTETLTSDPDLAFDGTSLTVGGTVTANAFSGNGSSLTNLVINHDDLQNILGGAPADYYHLTNTQHTDLTDSGTTTLHMHDHNSLPGYVANEHIDWTNTSVDFTTTGTASATAFYGDGSHLTGIASGGDITGSGTATQLAYFSSNKDITSGSGLIFDGTNLSVTGSETITGNLKVDSYLALKELTASPTLTSGYSKVYSIDNKLYFLDDAGVQRELFNSGSSTSYYYKVQMGNDSGCDLPMGNSDDGGVFSIVGDSDCGNGPTEMVNPTNCERVGTDMEWNCSLPSGTFEACFNFGHQLVVSGSAGHSIFKVGYCTGTTCTIAGLTASNGQIDSGGTSNGIGFYNPVNVCGTFTIPTAGNYTFVLAENTNGGCGSNNIYLDWSSDATKLYFYFTVRGI